MELAVEECIRRDILKEFLIAQRSEVVAMSIYEYNEEYVRKSFFEDGEKAGYDKGKSDGERAGYDKGESDGDASRLIKSVEAAMEHFRVDLQTACAGLGTTVEEYQKAKGNH